MSDMSNQHDNDGPESINPNVLTTIDNGYPDRQTKLEIVSPEFTCLCPEKPSQPDFGTITIEYVPDEHVIELKSLKLYLHSYRNEEIYHEAATNHILDDLVAICNPRWMRITGQFNVRGGLTTDVIIEHGDLPKDEIPTSRSTRTENLHRVPSEK